MRISLLLKNFTRYSDANLIEFARNITNKINQPTAKETETLQTIFIPNLTPNYNDMVDMIDAFEAAYIAFMNRGKHEKIVRDTRRKELMDALKLWAMQVEVFANGDKEILSDSGFELSKQPTPIPTPGAPVDFKVDSMHAGELSLSVKKVKGVFAFQFELTEEGTTDVMICSQGNNKCLLHNLKRGVYYNCKVAYIAHNHTKLYSETIRCVVK